MSPKIIKNTLSEKAMLVRLHIACWEGGTQDVTVSTEVTAIKRAEKGVGHWWSRIISRDELRPIFLAINAGRTLHAMMTLPWGQDEYRIISAEMFMEYSDKLRTAEREFEKAVGDFLTRYPDLVAGAKSRMGDLYRADAFPTVQKLRERFLWNTHVMPLPSAKDFRIDLGDDVTKAVVKDIESQINQNVAVAMTEVWQRLYTGVSKIAERLSDPENIFRDSLIGNVAELCDLLPKLNVTGSAELEKMRKEVMSKLTKRVPEELRNNDAERKTACDEAKAILDKMSAFLGKGK